MARRIRIEAIAPGDNGEKPLWFADCGCRYVPGHGPQGPIEFETWSEAMRHVKDQHLTEEQA